MKLKVENDVIANNIALFKYIIARSLEHNQVVHQPHSQEYQAFIHRNTGEIRFTLMDLQDRAIWCPVSFTLYQLDSDKKMHCQVRTDPIQGDSHILSAQSTRMLEQTVKTILLMVQMLPAIQNFSHLIKAFTDVLIEIDPSDGFLHSDLLHYASYNIDRYEVESLLSEHPVGSYCCRKDPFATLLEEQIQEFHQSPIVCITLSYVTIQKGVGEITLVHTNKGWLAYNDDPNLEEPRYLILEDLLKSLQLGLVCPVLHQ